MSFEGGHSRRSFVEGVRPSFTSEMKNAADVLEGIILLLNFWSLNLNFGLSG